MTRIRPVNTPFLRDGEGIVNLISPLVVDVPGIASCDSVDRYLWPLSRPISQFQC